MLFLGRLLWVRKVRTALRYVDTSSAFIDGSLRIPKSIIDKGLQKMKAALVAQFLGTVPPIRVVSAVVDKLWGYEGEVIVSKIAEGFFLFEFASENLAKWILKRSWHIHHSVMVLRRWEKNIAPIDLSPTNVPIWTIFKSVPAQLITQEGVGWLASHIGKPMNNFVRNGLDVKVCLLRNVDAEEITELSVTLEEDAEPVLIAIEYPQARSYNKPKTVKEWKVREIPVKGDNSSDAGDKGAESNKVIEIGEGQLGKGECEDTEHKGSGTEELGIEISTEEIVTHIPKSTEHRSGVNNNVTNNDEIVAQIPKSTVISHEERSVMATVISSAEKSLK
ncbi:hypothetical protein LINPERPRIM_LOCUS8964 [Linum perenne]